MASVPIPPTLTVFTVEKSRPMSLITLTLKAAPVPTLLAPQEHVSVVGEQTNETSGGQRHTLTTPIKLEAHHQKKGSSPPPIPGHEYNFENQALVELSVKHKQPYHGRLMCDGAEDTDDGYRGMFIRWEMRPLVGKCVAKNWRDIPVFDDTDDENDNTFA